MFAVYLPGKTAMHPPPAAIIAHVRHNFEAMKNLPVEYRHNFPLDPVDVVPAEADLPRIARMVAAPGLLLSAWVDGKLVGLARSLTDHAYCCYLSDLAVDKQYQGLGIGKELVRRTRAVIGDDVSLILLSAPDAMSYYPTLGFEAAGNAYVIRRKH
eukprot:gene22109-26539_t